MSIRYVAAVLDALPELSASETLVLIALADYASDDTLECWPSLKTICRRARCDRRTAQRILRRLEQAGLIEVNRGGHQYGVATASAYRLRFNHQGQRLDTPNAAPPQLSTRAAPNRPKLSTRAALTTGKGGAGDRQGRSYAAPSVIDPLLIQRASKRRPTEENSKPVTREEAGHALKNIGAMLERRRAAS